MKRGFGSKGQIWVETMVYTLIAFALIGIVLMFVKPKIEEIQDTSIIEQSIKVLEDLDFVINTLGGPGNQRVVELGVSKGAFFIDGSNDEILFKMESKTGYSEVGSNVTIGKIIANTQRKGSANEITLRSSYAGEYNLTFQNTEELKEITKASIPYKLIISDKGEDLEGDKIINLEVSS